MAPVGPCECHQADGRSACCPHGSGVGEPATGEQGADHPPLGHAPDGAQDVGDDARWGLDLGRGQLAEQPDEAAIAGQLCLAGQARLDMRYERGGCREPVIEDPRQLVGDL
jgi:hypothetical protein